MIRTILLILVLLSLPIGYFIYSSKDRVITELITAAQNNDLSAMSARVNWEDTRSFMKQDTANTKKALGGYGDNIGPDLSKIDEVIDYYIQPENIALLFHYRDRLFSDVTERDFIESISFAPPFGFHVKLAYPENAAKGRDMNALLKDKLKARIVFRMDGLSWRVKEIHVPIFMMPKRGYSIPAPQYYGIEKRQ